MQSQHRPKPEMDDDILQCKADVQKALQAVGAIGPKSTSSPQPSDEKSVQPLQSLQSENNDKSKLDLSKNQPSDADTSTRPVGVRILPFESLRHKSPPVNDTAAARPDASPPCKDLQDSLQKSVGQLKEKVREISDLQEKNRHLIRSLDESALSVTAKQQRIEELERQLAEKISELTALKLQAEEHASALAAQAQQFHQTDREKKEVEKQLEAKAAEWAKTIEAMKAAQQIAADTLLQRQRQLETLRAELADAESRLEQADAANTQLNREKAELLDALQEARMQFERDENDIESAFSDTADESLEPYCEPAGEVISEDDVHLEQKLADAETIPTFNLAEQIMAEQRKASAARRQRPQRTGKTPNSAIEHVMEQYISDTQPPGPPDEAMPLSPSSPAGHSARFLLRQEERLSGFQQALLRGIVQKDLLRYCGAKTSSVSYPRPICN